MNFRAIITLADPNFVHGTGEVYFCHPPVAHVGVEPLGLRLKIHHHLGTVDAFRVAREVVHFSGFSQLTSGLHALV